MNRLIRAAIPTLAAASIAVGCAEQAPEVTGINEVTTCTSWGSFAVGNMLTYDIVMQHDQDMGVQNSSYKGFYAQVINKATPAEQDGMISLPIGCTVETQQTDADIIDARNKAEADGMFYAFDTIQPSGANVILIAPFLDNGKVEN
jgi:hypothetical protein